jgi:hypothetical protein
MESGAGSVPVLSIELRQAPVDDGAARIELQGASVLGDRPRV